MFILRQNHVILIRRGTQTSTEWFFFKDKSQSFWMLSVSMSWFIRVWLWRTSKIQHIYLTLQQICLSDVDAFVGLIWCLFTRRPTIFFWLQRANSRPVRALCPLTALNQERAAPISYHFSQEAMKSLFMGNLTPKAYCCHMPNNTSCK